MSSIPNGVKVLGKIVLPKESKISKDIHNVSRKDLEQHIANESHLQLKTFEIYDNQGFLKVVPSLFYLYKNERLLSIEVKAASFNRHSRSKRVLNGQSKLNMDVAYEEFDLNRNVRELHFHTASVFLALYKFRVPSNKVI